MNSVKMGYKIAVFTLNQWTLDFTGNTRRIIESIDQANATGAVYRVGPELEICGYSVEDAFYETDTVYHSWRSLLKIIDHSRNMNIVIDIGMPVHFTSLYNCRVFVYKGRILCIRAKTSLAQEGIYREPRHFTSWSGGVTSYPLPAFVSRVLGQDLVPFGSNFILELNDGINQTLKVGIEICQELWDIKNVSADLYNNFGCHLVVNSSGSYWELRKLDTVDDMIKGISLRGGACYAFSNLIGCDGNRYVFYGRSSIYDRGQLVDMTCKSTDTFKEVIMATHIVSPGDIDEYRAQMRIKFGCPSDTGKFWDLTNDQLKVSQIDQNYKRFRVNIEEQTTFEPLIQVKPEPYLRFEEEINLFVPLWLWDYLRRSGVIGFMMPLSGGLDSSTVAVLVYSMCRYIYSNLDKPSVEKYFENTHKMDKTHILTEFKSPTDICKRLLRCCYLSTQFSSKDTLHRAKQLSQIIGCEFIDLSIQDTYENMRAKFGSTSTSVSLLDQNLQARLRMTTTYYLSGGNRIVLATGNVDEGIMGYLTKYDCSSADINPIGGMCKDDLRSYLKFCHKVIFKEQADLVRILEEIISAPPSAELTGAEQRDEDEIGLTYDEISVLGKVRRGAYGCNGPRGAFLAVWNNRFNAEFRNKIRILKSTDVQSDSYNPKELAIQIAKLIKIFFNRYARNRHKLTVLTPALHAETYSPDDNRFDHRHFLYAPWTEQFKEVDRLVDEICLSHDVDSVLQCR